MPIVVQDTAPAATDDPTAAPVLVLPLRLVGRSLATVTQGSSQELQQSVRLLLDTRPGERQATLDYGTPDIAFDRDVDPAIIEAALSEWEPRVTVTVTVDRSDPTDALVLAVIEPSTSDEPDDDEAGED